MITPKNLNEATAVKVAERVESIVYWLKQGKSREEAEELAHKTAIFTTWVLTARLSVVADWLEDVIREAVVA